MTHTMRKNKLRRITLLAALVLVITAILTVLFRYLGFMLAAKISFILFLIFVPICFVPMFIRTINNEQ